MSPIAARTLTVALALGGAAGAIAIPRALVEAASSPSISIAAPAPHRSTRIQVPASLLPPPVVIIPKAPKRDAPAPERPRVQSRPVAALAAAISATAPARTAAPAPAPARAAAKPKFAPAPTPAPAPAVAPEPMPDPAPIPIPEPVAARTVPQLTAPVAAEPAKRGKGHDKPKHEKRAKRDRSEEPEAAAPVSEPVSVSEEIVDPTAGEGSDEHEDEAGKEHGNGHGKGKGHEKKND